MKPIAQILDAFRSLREHRALAAPTDQALAELIREALSALEEAELSHDEIRRNLSAAVKAGKPSGNGYYCWVRDVFDDHLVYEEETPTGATLWQQGYTIDDAGKVTLGTEVSKVKVATTYVAVAESATLSDVDPIREARDGLARARRKLAAAAKLHQAHMDGTEPTSDASQKRLMGLINDALSAIGASAGPAMAESGAGPDTDELEEADLVGEIVPLVEKSVRQDGTFPIRIIAPGWGSSGYYSKQVLERDIPKVFPAGTHMHFDHPTVSESKERPERSVKTIAAVTSSLPVWQDNGPAGPGMYAEAKARSQYRADIEELAPYIGVSIVASGHRKTGIAEGRKGPVIESIHAGGSIDFVTQAGAGGQVISLFEAARSRAISEPITEVDEVSDQELKEAREALAAAQKEASDALAEAARLREGALLREARDVVATALAKVENLPDITRDRLLETIAKNPPTADGKLDAATLETQVSEAVRAEVEYLAKVTGSGRITGMGGAGSTSDAAVKESEDRIGAALARGFGLTEAETKQAVAGRSH